MNTAIQVLRNSPATTRNDICKLVMQRAEHSLQHAGFHQMFNSAKSALAYAWRQESETKLKPGQRTEIMTTWKDGLRSHNNNLDAVLEKRKRALNFQLSSVKRRKVESSDIEGKSERRHRLEASNIPTRVDYIVMLEILGRAKGSPNSKERHQQVRELVKTAFDLNFFQQWSNSPGLDSTTGKSLDRSLVAIYFTKVAVGGEYTFIPPIFRLRHKKKSFVRKRRHAPRRASESI